MTFVVRVTASGRIGTADTVLGQQAARRRHHDGVTGPGVPSWSVEEYGDVVGGELLVGLSAGAGSYCG
jgi:hypothetical protein